MDGCMTFDQAKYFNIAINQMNPPKRRLHKRKTDSFYNAL